MKNKRLRLLALALTATLALGACGGSGGEQSADLPSLASQTDDGSADDGDDPAGEGGGEVSEADQEKAFAEYESCMADAGIDLGELGGGDGAAVQALEVDDEEGGESFDPEAFEAAAEACDEILEATFGSFELTPEQEAEAADQMLEMQRCLSEKGFEIDLSGNAFELDENTDFEAFEEAMGRCDGGLEIGDEQ